MGSQSCYILLICALFLSGLPAVQVPTRLGPYGIAAPATSLPSHRSAAPASPAVLASVAIGAPAPQATLSVQPPVLNFTLPQGGGSASQPLTLTASGGALNFRDPRHWSIGGDRVLGVKPECQRYRDVGDGQHSNRSDFKHLCSFELHAKRADLLCLLRAPGPMGVRRFRIGDF